MVFNSLSVRLEFTELHLAAVSDRFWSGAEPYLLPVFFKVDGERTSIFLNISDDRDTSDGSDLFTIVAVTDPEGSPVVVANPAHVALRGDQLNAGTVVDISDITYDTDLVPIPFHINLGGLADESAIAAAIEIVVQALYDGALRPVINTAAVSFSALIAGLLGLDEEVEGCRDPWPGPNLVETIEASFHCAIPGTVGVIVAAMENDDWDLDDRLTIQQSIAGLVSDTINSMLDSVSVGNLIPDEEDHIPSEDEVMARILTDLFLRLDPVFWHNTLNSFIWGSTDDFVGEASRTYTHLDFAQQDQMTLTDNQPLVGGDNAWRVRGIARLR